MLLVSWVNVIRTPLKFNSILVGNAKGARTPDDPNVDKDCEESALSSTSYGRIFQERVQAVQTRGAPVGRSIPLYLHVWNLSLLLLKVPPIYRIRVLTWLHSEQGWCWRRSYAYRFYIRLHILKLRQTSGQEIFGVSCGVSPSSADHRP